MSRIESVKAHDPVSKYLATIVGRCGCSKPRSISRRQPPTLGSARAGRRMRSCRSIPRTTLHSLVRALTNWRRATSRPRSARVWRSGTCTGVGSAPAGRRESRATALSVVPIAIGVPITTPASSGNRELGSQRARPTPDAQARFHATGARKRAPRRTRCVTLSGNVRYAAPRESGSHADRWTALALALHAADTAPKGPTLIWFGGGRRHALKEEDGGRRLTAWDDVL